MKKIYVLVGAATISLALAAPLTQNQSQALAYLNTFIAKIDGRLVVLDPNGVDGNFHKSIKTALAAVSKVTALDSAALERLKELFANKPSTPSANAFVNATVAAMALTSDTDILGVLSSTRILANKLLDYYSTVGADIANATSLLVATFFEDPILDRKLSRATAFDQLTTILYGEPKNIPGDLANLPSIIDAAYKKLDALAAASKK